MYKVRSIGNSSLIKLYLSAQSIEGEELENDAVMGDHHYWDVHFVRQKRKFRIHRFLLSRISSYFRKNIHYSEFEKMKVETGETVKGECSSGILSTFENFFIPYIYNEEVYINEKNFVYVYQIASRWQFDEILRLCSQYPIVEKTVIDFVNIYLNSRMCEFGTPEDLQNKLFKFCVENFDKIEKVERFNRIEDAHYMTGIVETTKHDVQSSLTSWMNVNFKLLYDTSEDQLFEKILKILKLNEFNVLSVYNVLKHFNMPVTSCLEVVVEKFMLIPNVEFKKFHYTDFLSIVKGEEGTSREVQEKKFKVVLNFHETEIERRNQILDQLERLESSEQLLELGVARHIDVDDIMAVCKEVGKNNVATSLVLFLKQNFTQKVHSHCEDRMAKLWDCVDFSVLFKETIDLLTKLDFVPRKTLMKIVASASRNSGVEVGVQYDLSGIVSVPSLSWGKRGDGISVSGKDVTMNSGNHYCARSAELFEFGAVNVILVKITLKNCCGYIGISQNTGVENFNQGFQTTFSSIGYQSGGSLGAHNSSGSVLITEYMDNWNSGDLIIIVVMEETVSFFRNWSFRGSIKIDKSKGNSYFVLADQDSSGRFRFEQENPDYPKIEECLKILESKGVSTQKLRFLPTSVKFKFSRD